MTHFIAVREKLHSNLLGLHVQTGNWITDGSLHSLAAGLFSKSAGIADASGRALGIVTGRIRLQAYTLTFIDGFYLIAGACVLALLLVALISRFPLSYGDLGAFQDIQVPQQDGEK
jgi:DHA2 family multidrug resistance protein